jgi:hypothetical protein
MDRVREQSWGKAVYFDFVADLVVNTDHVGYYYGSYTMHNL